MFRYFFLLCAAEDCKSYGFGSSLVCQGCDDLDNYVSDKMIHRKEDSKISARDKLLTECRSCCKEDRVFFERAKFYYDPKRLVEDSDLRDFIEHKAERFKNLELVEKKKGHFTMIVFVGENKEQHRVDDWKSNAIRRFLQMKLRN